MMVAMLMKPSGRSSYAGLLPAGRKKVELLIITQMPPFFASKASAGTRMMESIGQSNRVLLNINTDYNARLLASDIRTYFEVNAEAIEVLIFKGKKLI